MQTQTEFRQSRPATLDEWRSAPALLSTTDVARLTGRNRRVISRHAEQFGGRLIAGRWVFSITELARILGVEL